MVAQRGESTMKTNRLLAIMAAAAALSSGQTPAKLTVDLNKQKSPVSPTLYGLMTEEINYSYDGGLYAELIRNRTFRSDWSGVLNWFLVERGNSAAKFGADPKSGPSEALPGSARLDVAKADPANPVGIINEGYWGIPVRPNAKYTGSFWAKSDTAESVKVAIVGDDSGKPVASADVALSGDAWKEYKFEFTAGPAAVASAANHLEITVGKPGTLWLQLVSLFPPTYHGRPGGDRIDLSEKLAAMKPSFLRFPGGNYLEGNRIDT